MGTTILQNISRSMRDRINPREIFRSTLPTRILALIVFMALWQFVSRFYPSFLLPSPILTFNSLIELIADGSLPTAFVQSLRAFSLALAVAIPSAILLGLVLGSFPRIEDIVDPFLNALYVTPKAMLIPLFIIWFGIGIEARIAYILVISYFPIMVNTIAGIRQVRGALTETARAFGASTTDMFFKILLPGSVPMIMAGIRLAVGRAVVGMIIAEMFLALVGLGYMVVDFGNRLATDKVLAMVIVVSTFGILVTEIVKWAEKRIAPWSLEEDATTA